MRDDITIIERNSDVLLNASKDIGLAVNTRKVEPHRGKMGIDGRY